MCKWNQLTCYFRHNWSLKFVEVRDFQPYTDCQEWELVRSCQLMSTILFSKVCKKDLIEFMVVVSSVILMVVVSSAKQASFQIGLEGNKCNGIHCMSNTSKTFSIIIDSSELDDEVIYCSFSIYTP